MDRKNKEQNHFKEALLSLMDRKNHRAWRHFSGPKADRAQLKIHYRQEYAVYVRDFPVFLGRIHGKNPPSEVRRELALNLYEEETGGLSFGRSHPALFLKMMRGLGLRASDLQKIELLPKSLTYRRWLDEVTLSHHWLEGAAVTLIFVEGSVHDRKEIEPEAAPRPSIEKTVQNHFLVRFQQVDPDALDLIRAHQKVEQGHRLAAWKIVLRYARSRSAQQRVHDRLKRTLDLWLAYRDGVAEAAGVPLF